MSDRMIRTLLSLFMGGVTGFLMGSLFGDKLQGILIGLILGAVFGLFVKGDQDKTG